jgi:hypothetical protein
MDAVSALKQEQLEKRLDMMERLAASQQQTIDAMYKLLQHSVDAKPSVSADYHHNSRGYNNTNTTNTPQDFGHHDSSKQRGGKKKVHKRKSYYHSDSDSGSSSSNDDSKRGATTARKHLSPSSMQPVSVVAIEPTSLSDSDHHDHHPNANETGMRRWFV